MKKKFSLLMDLTKSKFEHLNEESSLIRGGSGAATNSTSSNYQCDNTKVCCTVPPDILTDDTLG